MVTGFEIFESSFESKIFIGFEIIAFLLKSVFAFFHEFSGISQEPRDFFVENLFVSHEGTSKGPSESL